MASAERKIDGFDPSETEVDLQEYGQVIEMRKKIDKLASNEEWRQFVSQGKLRMYQQYIDAQTGILVANDNKYSSSLHADDLRGLRVMYDFMYESWEKAKRRFSKIKGMLDQISMDELGTREDVAFLEGWIKGEDYDFTDATAAKFESVIQSKIERLKENKAEFLDLSTHRLIDRPNLKRFQEKQGVKCGDVKSFLEKGVPVERRDFLKKFKDALSAEEGIEALENKEIEKSVAIYSSRFDQYYSTSPGKGFIGEKTRSEFEASFELMAEERDFEGMKKWHQLLADQMQPRQEIWEKIRTDFRQPALAELEGMMHAHGLTDMTKAYESMKVKEMSRLDQRYCEKWEQFKGVFYGQHTVNEYVAWMAEKADTLSAKYAAHDGFDIQLVRYKQLWQDVDLLLPEQKVSMRSKLTDSSWGYSEFEVQLKAYQFENLGNPNAPELMLNQVQDTATREVIRDLGGDLNSVRLEAMIGVVGRMLELSSQTLEQDFEGVVEEDILLSEEPEFEEFQSDDVVVQAASRFRSLRFSEAFSENDSSLQVEEMPVENEVEDPIDSLQKNQRTNVVQLNQSRYVRHVDSKSTRRVSEVVLNKKESLDYFFGENARQAYYSGSANGNDHLTMQVQVPSGQAKVLKRQDLLVLRGYLKLKQAKVGLA